MLIRYIFISLIFLVITRDNIVESVGYDRQLTDQVQDETSCEDSTLKFFYQKPDGKKIRRTCNWARKKPYRCKLSAIASHCPSSCSTCSTIMDSEMQFGVRIDGNKGLQKRKCKFLMEELSNCSIPGVAQTCRKSCENVEIITKAPVVAPTKAPVVAPTKAPVVAPTVPPGSVATGKTCSKDSECKSNYCDTSKNICYATRQCKAIKHEPGTEFDKDHVILVFVGSGFTSLTSLQNQVQNTYSVFKKFPFFEDSVTQFSAFSVDHLQPSFCNFNCHGIARLLCCNVSVARSIGNRCFPPGATVQTIVVHNSATYGGAGYISSNLATTSTHPSAPLVAVHELGHSLFDFYDEYTYISSTPSGAPNCDSSSNCAKWNDLIGKYPSVCSARGCAGGRYFVSESTSFMKALNYNVGPILRRYTCCTYLSLTGSSPSYCNEFLDIGMGLYNYCAARGYTIADLLPGPIQDDDDVGSERPSISTQGGTYLYVAEPSKLELSVSDVIESHPSTLVVVPNQVSIESGYYNEESINGEGMQDNTQQETMIEVVIKFISGEEKTLYFSQFQTVDVPLPLLSDEDEDDVQIPRTDIEVILDGSDTVDIVEMRLI